MGLCLRRRRETSGVAAGQILPCCTSSLQTEAFDHCFLAMKFPTSSDGSAVRVPLIDVLESSFPL